MNPVVACAGEILVDLIPTEVGEYRDGMLIEVHFGGAPANVAIGVSRLGVPAAFIGAVGDDPFGRMLVEYLRREGVYTGWIPIKRARTSLAFVISKPGGEREFFFYRPPWATTADTLLSEGDVDWEAVKRVRVLHVSGVALSHPPLRDTVVKLMEVVGGSGGLVSFDPNFRADVWLGDVERARREMLQAFELSSLVTLGRDELEPLLGVSGFREAASRLLSLSPSLKYVAVRLGGEGAYVATSRGEEAYVEAFRVPVVDTTGAGDAWTAAFIVFHLVEGRGLKDSVLLANAVAAMKCMRRGATSGMPRRGELAEFLRARGLAVPL